MSEEYNKALEKALKCKVFNHYAKGFSLFIGRLGCILIVFWPLSTFETNASQFYF